MFIVSNKKEESISIHRVNYPSPIYLTHLTLQIVFIHKYVTVSFLSIALYRKMGFKYYVMESWIACCLEELCSCF